MIKSDRWIRQQCIPPKFVVTENRVTGFLPGTISIKPVEYFSHDSAEELDAKISARRLPDNELLVTPHGVQHFRPVTQEDLKDWRPMISPYVDGQVREIERNGTPSEMNFLRANGAKALADKVRTTSDRLRVDPLLGLQIRQKIVSYGTSSFGYDVRLADEFKIFTNVFNGVIDPLKADEKERVFVDHKGPHCVIPPNSYILGYTMERFVIPRDVMVLCVGKSTYARCGAIVNVTPIEAGFEGSVVIEISNATPLPLVVHAGQGIAQFMFFQSDEPCEVSYADRGGKYQGQSGLQTALV